MTAIFGDPWGPHRYSNLLPVISPPSTDTTRRSNGSCSCSTRERLVLDCARVVPRRGAHRDCGHEHDAGEDGQDPAATRHEHSSNGGGTAPILKENSSFEDPPADSAHRAANKDLRSLPAPLGAQRSLAGGIKSE